MDNRKLSKKGRYGDTHIRDVYGLKSHVNKDEAKLIDSYGLLGEMIVKETGAGTTNPNTGFPEYHTGWKHIGSGHNLMHALHATGQGYDPHAKDSPLIAGGLGHTNIFGGVTEGDYTKTAEEIEEERIAEMERKGGNPANPDLGYESGIAWNPTGGNYNVNMTSEIWNGMSDDQKIDYIAMTEFSGVIPPEYDTIDEFKEFVKNKLDRFDPIKEDIDPTKAGFFAEKYGGTVDPVTGEYIGAEFGPGEDGLYGTDDDPGGLAGRAAGTAYATAGRTYESAGLTYGDAERAYITAGLTHDAAEQDYTLGLSGSERRKGDIKTAYELGVGAVGRARETAGMELETGLGNLQTGADQVGDILRSYQSGMGSQLRGAIKGQSALKKGLGQEYGKYGLAMEGEEDEMTRLGGILTSGLEGEVDIQTGLTGDWGRAQDIYELSGETYWDEYGQKKLGTLGTAGAAYDIAGDAYTSAKDVYDIAEDEASLWYRQGMYDLEGAPETKWQGDWSDFLAGFTTPAVSGGG